MRNQLSSGAGFVRKYPDLHLSSTGYSVLPMLPPIICLPIRETGLLPDEMKNQHFYWNKGDHE
jgi:hypothetical protein